MSRKIVFVGAHRPEFMDKWMRENEAAVNELIESGALDSKVQTVSSDSDVANDAQENAPDGASASPDDC